MVTLQKGVGMVVTGRGDRLGIKQTRKKKKKKQVNEKLDEKMRR